MKTTKEEKTHSMEMLNKFLAPGKTVHGVVRKVSSSGMSRQIDFYTIADGEMVYLSGYIGQVCGYTRTDSGALRVSGCGMDMIFSVVYNLGRAMFPNGFTLADNQQGRNCDKSGFDTDGGYAFNYRSI